MTADARTVTGVARPLPLLLLVVALGALHGLAAWPIYRTPRVWLLITVAAGCAAAVTWAGRRWRWGGLTPVALLAGFLILLVPLAVPNALQADPQRLGGGLADGLGAIALGWKQVLTLTLPVGSYQAVLVPLLVTVFGTVALAVWLALHSPRTAVWAALPAVGCVAFGTLLGPAELSDALRLGPVSLSAPRELALWGASGVLIAVWVGWISGAARRAALRLGRSPGARARGVRRGAAGAATVLVALTAGAVLAPAVVASPRVVPRDRIDPVVVVREQVSPLAGYRVWKRDAALTDPLFRVSREGPLPARLRLAVLDSYDGVDLTPSSGSGRFTRFPSAAAVSDPGRITVTIEAGYTGIWVPLGAELGGPPEFAGPRAAELADAFYVDHDTGAGIAVPTAAGLHAGDRYTVEVSTGPEPGLGDRPVAGTPRRDLSAQPQLERWLQRQGVPATGSGLTAAVDRLRARGYLSHALSDDVNREWLDRAAAAYGTRFVASAGGHSIARIEELFAQLNEQEAAAGSGATDADLVAGVGDDEQFATAVMLLAQALGFDARVVVGVRLGGPEVPGVPACTETCTGEHLAAWAEVRGADGVWAPLDASPQAETPPRSTLAGERLPEYPTIPEERDAPERDPEFGAGLGDVAPPAAAAADLADEWTAPVLRWVGWGLAVALLIAGAVLFVPAVKWARRYSRRRAATPETRVLGAWEEFLDVHADAGAGLPRASAHRGVTQSRRDQAGILPGGRALAAAVDRAVFAPEPPTAAEADAVWATVTEHTRQLRASRSRWQRLRSLFSFASLRARGTGKEQR